MKIVYITWAENCSRSDHTARELGGVSYMVYWGWLGSHPATVGLKYLGQALSTWRLLLRNRPRAVFVMVPPVFAALTVAAYCALTRVPFVMDAHTAAFMHPRWRRWQWLQRWLAARAASSIVTNDHLAAVVRASGATATLVPDVPVVFDAPEPLERDERFTIVAVCSFNADEPIAEIIEAARLRPDVRVLMTGNPRHLAASLRHDLPPNLSLTGFVSDGRYGGLIRGADLVLTLTTRDHTMLRAAYEAIYNEQPVLVSDWPVLRRSFDEGAVHVASTPSAIASGIDEARSNIDNLRAGARRLRARKLARWTQSRNELLRCIGAAPMAGD